VINPDMSDSQVQQTTPLGIITRRSNQKKCLGLIQSENQIKKELCIKKSGGEWGEISSSWNIACNKLADAENFRASNF
jgi:hypothetical protein